ncbi:MAG: flagellar assembly protein FliX [Phenylobacterium sp.]
MKVTGPSGVSAGPSSAKRSGAAGEAFAVPAAAGSARSAPAAPTAGVSGVIGVEALLALQDVGGPLEGRRRSIRRAGRLLDVLDNIKVALIEGVLSPDQLCVLNQIVSERREATGDPGLDGLLDEIDTRAAVELAKMEARGLIP